MDEKKNDGKDDFSVSLSIRLPRRLFRLFVFCIFKGRNVEGA